MPMHSRKWKLSDYVLWDFHLKPKWLTTCIRTPLEWKASTQAARSKLRDTVSNRCSMLWRLSRRIPESHQLPALWMTLALKVCNYFGGCSLRLIQDVTSSLTLGRDPQVDHPLLWICSPTFSPSFCSCSIIYWPLHGVQQSTVALCNAEVTQ